MVHRSQDLESGTMTPGKDGRAFDMERWLRWASNPTSRPRLKFNREQEPVARGIANRKTMKRSGNIRKPCPDCGRMNHISQKVCKCGRSMK
jgi:hypothetical protein